MDQSSYSYHMYRQKNQVMAHGVTNMAKEWYLLELDKCWVKKACKSFKVKECLAGEESSKAVATIIVVCEGQGVFLDLWDWTWVSLGG